MKLGARKEFREKLLLTIIDKAVLGIFVAGASFFFSGRLEGTKRAESAKAALQSKRLEHLATLMDDLAGVEKRSHEFYIRLREPLYAALHGDPKAGEQALLDSRKFWQDEKNGMHSTMLQSLWIEEIFRNDVEAYGKSLSDVLDAESDVARCYLQLPGKAPEGFTLNYDEFTYKCDADWEEAVKTASARRDGVRAAIDHVIQ